MQRDFFPGPKWHVQVGHCTCRAVTVDLVSPVPLSDWTARACGCTFCRAHDGVYCSNPLARAHVHAHRGIGVTYQGTETAKMLFCPGCGDFIGVGCDISGVLLGALRVRLFDGWDNEAVIVQVAPGDVSRDRRLARWRKIWMPLHICPPI